MNGAFPRLDPELRRLRLYRIELIDMHACKAQRVSVIVILPRSSDSSMHGTEQTVESIVIFL